jgi:NADPH:quinone reductase-like Zn-dependent oxidoreductase
MMPIPVETVVEVVLGLILLYVTSYRPRTVAYVAFALATASGYVLTQVFSYKGAAIVGSPTMRAAIFAPENDHGLVLGNVPVPDHTSSQVLVKVSFASLNPSNYKIVPARIPVVRHLKKFIVGYDLAGVVLSVGTDPSCSSVKAGEEVFGFAPMGSIAEYAAVSCNHVMQKPKKLTLSQAAGLPVAALTSLEAFQRSNLQPGESVLIIGASGGCGSFAVQIAKAMGAASVTGICSTRNVEFIRSLLPGDKHAGLTVVDYHSEEQMAALKARGAAFDGMLPCPYLLPPLPHHTIRSQHAFH